MIDGLYRRRRLPHLDVEGGIYFVTTCLEGSVPAQGLLDYYRYRDELAQRPRPEDLSDEEWRRRNHKLLFARFDAMLDLTPAVKHLADPAAADLVRNALYHFAGQRYHLLAYVVMPSHFHWVFQPCPEWVESLPDRGARRTARERIMKSINGFTAYQCMRLLGLTGTFWQHEGYDHVVRDDDELLRIVEYVELNPVKAGLVSAAADWRWSSAADRPTRTVVPGELALR